MWTRYAIVRQEGASDCGAAALATVALHSRRPVRLSRLRDLAGTDPEGASLSELSQAAERSGFSARAARGSYEALGRVPLPAIAHLLNERGAGHFVVVH